MKINSLIEQTITLPNQLEVTPESQKIRNDLLLASRECKVANTAPEANSVGESARDIRSFVKEVRDMGLSLRRPLKAAQDQIKVIEDNYCAELEAEQARLEGIAGAYMAAERKRVDAEEAKRRAEVERVQAERAEQERLAREENARIEREQKAAEEKARADEAERARIESEALVALDSLKAGLYDGERYEVVIESKQGSKTIGYTNDAKGAGLVPEKLPKGAKVLVVELSAISSRQLANNAAMRRAQIEEDARRIEAERQESIRRAEDLRQAELARQKKELDAATERARLANIAVQAVVRAPAPEQHKIGGMSNRRVMKYEVTDIAALYKARPELCKPLEVKPSAIQAVCVPRFPSTSNEVDTETVLGLKLWWEDSTSTRKW